MLNIRDAKSCKYDLVSLGECMIRLSPPGYGRIEFAPLLEVWVGGGEYNVSYALARLPQSPRLRRQLDGRQRTDLRPTVRQDHGIDPLRRADGGRK